jgi:NAD(P)-dependent dehydrogenase (short-subunit alcohol dehydrogenase family)
LGEDGLMQGVAIVTGAAHGIGLAVAQRLCTVGFQVAAVDVDADALKTALLPDGTLRICRDVSDDPEPLLAEVVASLGVPTALVNNAGGMDGRSFLELPMEAVRRSVETMLLGTWGLSRAMSQLVIAEQRSASIVFMLSLHTHRVRMAPDYSVSKAALLMLMKELSFELGPHSIRVNAVSPGAIDTWSDRIPDPQEHAERTARAIPLGRVGAPEDVAKAVEFLLDDERSGYITGTDLVVDGGLDQFNWLHAMYGSAAAERDREGGNR